MKYILIIITVLFCFNASAQQTYATPPGKSRTLNQGYPEQKIDSTQFVKLLSLKDLQEIAKSLEDKMTVTEWKKVTEAIDKVYLARRQEYLKSKDTAKTK